MNKLKIHIFGASGSGVSTLGKLLSANLEISFFDSDDYYWKKTNPPFQVAHSITERQILLKKAMANHSSWVLSGTLVSWGDFIQHEFDLAVYLWAPAEARIQRIKLRESMRFGDRIEKGGDMYETHQKFLEWVAQYDEGILSGRSKQKHEKWMTNLKCPVLRIEGLNTPEQAVQKILQYLAYEVY